MTTLEDLHRAMFDTAYQTLRGEGLHIVGPMAGPRRAHGTAWLTIRTGGGGCDVALAEHRVDDGVTHLGVPGDTGLWQLAAIEAEARGEGARWIMSHWAAVCDHLLPECPAVRRHRHTARWGVGLVDPDGSDLCGWCVRVYRARRAKAAA